MTYTATASTGTVDLDKDRVLSWDLQGRTKFPLMWQHEHESVPVGVAEVLSTTKADGSAEMRVSLDFYGDERSQTVEKAVNDQALNALSVGFYSEDYTPNDFGGYDFKNAKLYEISVVLVGANPEALIDQNITEKGATIKGHRLPMTVKGLELEQDDETIEPADEVEIDDKTTTEESTPSEDDEVGPSDGSTHENTDTDEVETVKEPETMVVSESSTQKDAEPVDKSKKRDIIEPKAPTMELDNLDTNKGESKMNAKKQFLNNLKEAALESVKTPGREIFETYKSLDYDDVETFEIQEIIDNGKPSQVDALLSVLKPVAPLGTVSKILTADLTEDEAQALAHVTGEKVEQVVHLTNRETNTGVVYALQRIGYKQLVEDKNNVLMPWVLREMTDQLHRGIVRQILIGNPFFADHDVNIDDKIRPIATDDSVFTTQATWEGANFVELVQNLAKIKSDGAIAVVMNKATISKLGLETAEDGHFLLGVPGATPAKLGEYLGADVFVFDELNDDEVIAFDVNSYRRSAPTGTVDTFQGYKISTNQQEIEKVTDLAGALTLPLSALHIVADGGNNGEASFA